MDDNQAEMPALTVPAPEQNQSEDKPESILDPSFDAVDEPEGEAKTETETPAKDDKADEESDGEDTDDAEAEKPKRRSGVQRLKDKVQRLEAELAERNSAPSVRSNADLDAAIQAEIGPPPRESDFSDYLAFEDAKALWRNEYALAKRDIRGRVEQFTARQQERVRDLVSDFEEGQITARKSIPDYDTVLKSAAKAPVAPHVEGLILESDKSALIAYHLAKNPEKLDRLNALPPIEAAREIGRLEARLSLPSAKTATNAPKPIASVKGGASPTPKLGEMSMEEYAAARSKGWKG